MNLVLFLLLFVIIPFTPSFAEEWRFDEFVQDDIFEYHICDGYTLDSRTVSNEKCYDLTFYVVDRYEIDFGNVWLLHVKMNSLDGVVLRDLVLIDDSFNVHSFHHKYIEDSMGNTLFWMYTNLGHFFDLEIGNTIPGRTDDFVVTDFERDESMEYTISSDSGDFFILNDDLYLPIRGNIDTGYAIFDFELKSFHNSAVYTGNSNVLPFDNFMDESFEDFGDTEIFVQSNNSISVDGMSDEISDDIILEDTISATEISDELEIDIPQNDIPVDAIPDVMIATENVPDVVIATENVSNVIPSPENITDDVDFFAWTLEIVLFFESLF